MTRELPGLSGDFDHYPIIEFEGEKYREIPFSDWLPSDFETVPCSRGGGLIPMWYSPARNMMIFDNGCGMKAADLKLWLRKL